MKSGKFWAGFASVMVLCCVSFAFGESDGHNQSLDVTSGSSLPASLLISALAPGGNLHRAKPQNGGWGGGGGGGGCGGNGGWSSTGNSGTGGWGGGGNGGNGGCGVPEGGNSLGYLLIAALSCIGAMIYRARRQNAVSEI